MIERLSPVASSQSLTRWFGLLTALPLAACSAAAPLLNSDRIEQKYGSHGVETFREAGWAIKKETLLIDEVTVPAENEALGRLMRIELPAELAVLEYQFVISKDGQSFTYARITEYYHPDYLGLADLQSISY